MPIDSYEKRIGYLTEDGKQVFETPPRDLLLRNLADNRVSYFPSRLKLKRGEIIEIDGEQIEATGELVVPFETSETMILEETKDEAPGKIAKYLAGSAIFTPLAAQIAESFLGNPKTLGIRGTVCSLGEHIERDHVFVKTPSEILSSGTDRLEQTTAVTGFGADWPEIHYQSANWCFDTTREVRQQLGVGSAEARKVFPVILVYDMSRLTHKHRYEYNLPVGGDQALAILHAYIIDYPAA